jgi:Fe-S cluster assembly protein SufB
MIELDYSKYDFKDPEKYVFKAENGLSRRIIEQISEIKKEPEWMKRFRIKALEVFFRKKLPEWGADLSKIDFNEFCYYAKPTESKGKSWEEVPAHIKRTYERLGIPQAERRFLAGVETQYESEVVYGNLRKDLEKRGVIFVDTDSAVKKYPELVKKYFGTVVPMEDNKFAALNSACWSGGSFIYVPKGVKVELPLQAYFRINAKNMGQFERTLIIADEGSSVCYIEGCTAPIYSSNALHSAVVEIIAHKNARVRYTTLQNWSKDVYNLVTKRAVVYENALVEWIDLNIGSKATMKYPSVFLIENGAKGDVLSIAIASEGQHQDVGAKSMHFGKNTTSKIVSKSISMRGGRTSYRGLVKIGKGANGAKASVRCDALILDEISRSDTYPMIEIEEEDSNVMHEATVGKIGAEKLFYLVSRGLKEDEALALIVLGFIEPLSKELPMEYAVELNRLIKLEMENAVG